MILVFISFSPLLPVLSEPGKVRQSEGYDILFIFNFSVFFIFPIYKIFISLFCAVTQQVSKHIYLIAYT